MKNSISLAAVVAFLSVPAFAGDLSAPVVEAPVMVAEPVVVPTWTGGYVGGNVNYGFGSLDATDAFAAALAGGGFGSNLSEPDGVNGALRAGYDWQFGRGVFGLGGEYNFGSYEGVGEGALAGSGLNVEIEDVATIFARAGYAVNDQFLAYGLLGYTQAEGTATQGGGSQTEDLDGVTFGLGGEYLFTQNWSGYGEYTYTDFGDIDNTGGQLEADLHQVKFGVNYRF